MAISAATLRVDVDMNTGAAERQLAGFGQKLNGFAATAARAGSAMFTGLAMGAGMAMFNGLVAGAGNAVRSMGDAGQAASNLGETINKVNMIMGDSAAAIMEWSQDTATSMGMGQQSALDAASTFGMFGKSAGLTGDALSKFSMQFTGLAADMASFNNTTPEEAIMAIGAALRGESEPIRRYNVLLDDATLRQRAVKLGIIETTKEALLPQQRVLAAQAEIWAQTAVQQGDFARTSDGLANQQRILTANTEKLTLTVGNALLPVFTQWTALSNQLVTAVLPSLGSLISTYVVPAMTNMATVIGEAGVRFGEFMDDIAAGADPIGAFVDMFNLEPWVEQINNAITWFAWMGSEWEFEVSLMKWTINEWAIGFAVAVNRVIDAINLALSALAELDAKQRVVAGGMALISGNVGAAYNMLMAQPATFSTIPTMPVPASQVMPTAGAFTANTIATSGWGESGRPYTGWGEGSAAREAADKAAAESAQRLAQGMNTLGTASTGAGAAITGLGGAATSAADELASALRGVPGLFGTSSVTAGDMAKAGAGMAVNFADDYVRRVGDELLNGVDLAEIDPAEVAASLNMDPSVPAELIYNELVRQWGSGEYFANPDNIAKINWTAVQAKLDQDARAVLGQSNILAAAIAQGITLDSMKPVAEATVAGMTGALESSNLGAATGATTLAAMATPEAAEGFTASGESAANVWIAGWEARIGEWIPPTPATPPPPPSTTTDLVENPTAPPAVPIQVIPYRPPGYTPPGPPGRTGSSGTSVNITINGADANNAGAIGRATSNAVLDALRARGRI